MRPETAGAKFRCEGTLERELRARGFRAVAGVDEVGRGCLFGPVVAAAVVLVGAVVAALTMRPTPPGNSVASSH